MRINEHTALSTSKVLLVPYCRHHVVTYHRWMQDEELREATASEPLSIDEEHAMQRSWRTDQDKLTFITCLPIAHSQCGKIVEANLVDADDRMIGDVNIFLHFLDNDEDTNHETNGILGPRGIPMDKQQFVVGELELMIAEKTQQGHGYGRAALLAMMWYVLSNWSAIAEEFVHGVTIAKPVMLAHLRAKVNCANVRSISLFKSLGFEQCGGPSYFREIELRWNMGEEALQKLKDYEQPTLLEYGNIDEV